MDFENPYKILRGYIYRSPDAPMSWYEWDHDHGKEISIKSPELSPEMKRMIADIKNLVTNSDFWKNENVASLIKIYARVHIGDIVNIEVRKNHLAFVKDPDKAAAIGHWYVWDDGDGVVDLNTKQRVELDNYKDMKDIVDRLKNSPLKSIIKSIDFCYFNMALSMILFKTA